MRDLSDKILDVAFKITIPTVVATSERPEKWVRVLGFLGMFLLFPLVVVGAPVFIAGFCVMVFEDI